jgi:hypothetical protein
MAPAALAAQRYAAPEGLGAEPCAMAEPCSLEEAVGKAEINDEVIVTGGTYTVASNVYPPPEATNLYIHGDFAGPAPVLSGTLFGPVLPVSNSGSRISYLDIRNTESNGGGLSCGPKSTVERVRISVIGESSVALTSLADCTVHDSLLLASGEKSAALGGFGFSGASTGVVRNVTAIATGPESTGVKSAYYNPGPEAGSHTIDLKNSIARGQGADLLAMYGLEGPGNIDVANSNFETRQEVGGAKVTDIGGNQKAAPIFVDAAHGDYREASGSPTIDAGVADRIGTLDLAGAPRLQGPAPDIGAYEAAAPPAPPAPGQVQSLTISPKAFRAVNAGGAIVSRRDRRPAIGATVSYSMSAAGTATFTVARALPGRRVGKACKPVTRANRHRGKCTRSKPVRGSFETAGAAGANSFKFSGRLGGRALRPGRYLLLCSAGGVTMSVPFKIVK